MTVTHDSGEASRSGDWGSRLKRARLMLLAAAAVFALLWLAGALAALPALAGFVAVAAAAVIAAGGGEAVQAAFSADTQGAPRADDPLLEATAGRVCPTRSWRSKARATWSPSTPRRP